MKFTLFDHAGKGLYLRQRLIQAGHQEATTPDELEVLLVDCDWPWAYPRPALIEAASNRGAKIVAYPHGGMPTVFVYDGITTPDPRVDLRLEHGPGSVEIAKCFAEGLKQTPTGWLFSPTNPFAAVEKPHRILFAPLHANIEALVRGSNGHDPAPLINQRIYRRLLGLGVELVVSLASPAWRTGVWPHPRARFTANPHMLFQHSFEQILSCDVVVAAGTIAAAAVALGKPTVMFAQDTFYDYVNGEYVHAQHQDDYRELVRYPLDADDNDLAALIEQACAEEQTGWRELWVGDDGTQNAVGLLEGLVGYPVGKANSDVKIEGVTARALTRN